MQPANRSSPYDSAVNDRQPRRIEYSSNNRRNNKPQWTRRNEALPPSTNPRASYFVESNEPHGPNDDASPDDNEGENEPPDTAAVFFNDSSEPRHGNPPYPCQPCHMTYDTFKDLRHTPWIGMEYHQGGCSICQ